MTSIRELVNGVTADNVLHILWRDRDSNAVTPLCTDDELPGLVVWQGFDAVPSCTGCLAAFCAVDDAVGMVTARGLPGGHPDVHDDNCPLACSCGPDPDAYRWCRRHEGMWLDPAARQTLRRGGCYRLSGCHWPKPETAADPDGQVTA